MVNFSIRSGDEYVPISINGNGTIFFPAELDREIDGVDVGEGKRIIVVDGGKVVADGPKAQVIEALRQGRIGRAA